MATFLLSADVADSILDADAEYYPIHLYGFPRTALVLAVMSEGLLRYQALKKNRGIAVDFGTLERAVFPHPVTRLCTLATRSDAVEQIEGTKVLEVLEHAEWASSILGAVQLACDTCAGMTVSSSNGLPYLAGNQQGHDEPADKRTVSDSKLPPDVAAHVLVTEMRGDAGDERGAPEDSHPTCWPPLLFGQLGTSNEPYQGIGHPNVLNLRLALRQAQPVACNVGTTTTHEFCIPSATTASTKPVVRVAAHCMTPVEKGSEYFTVAFLMCALGNQARAQQELALTLSLETGFEIFWPSRVGVPIAAPYSPTRLRQLVHDVMLFPNAPAFGYNQRLRFGLPSSNSSGSGGGNVDGVSLRNLTFAARRRNGLEALRTARPWRDHLQSRVHLIVKSRPLRIAGPLDRAVVSGEYDYYHYQVDGYRDDEWGCCYRTLQTILSWFWHRGFTLDSTKISGHQNAVPTVLEIQTILSIVDPKYQNQKGFVGSRTWIGTYEAMQVLQFYIPDFDCTLTDVDGASELQGSPALKRMLYEHFRQSGGPPVLVSSGSRATAIIGIEKNDETGEALLLVLDPHYSSRKSDVKIIVSKGWVGWNVPSNFFRGDEPDKMFRLLVPKMRATKFY